MDQLVEKILKNSTEAYQELFDNLNNGGVSSSGLAKNYVKVKEVLKKNFPLSDAAIKCYAILPAASSSRNIKQEYNDTFDSLVTYMESSFNAKNKSSDYSRACLGLIIFLRGLGRNDQSKCSFPVRPGPLITICRQAIDSNQQHVTAPSLQLVTELISRCGRSALPWGQSCCIALESAFDSDNILNRVSCYQLAIVMQRKWGLGSSLRLIKNTLRTALKADWQVLSGNNEPILLQSLGALGEAYLSGAGSVVNASIRYDLDDQLLQLAQQIAREQSTYSPHLRAQTLDCLLLAMNSLVEGKTHSKINTAALLLCKDVLRNFGESPLVTQVANRCLNTFNSSKQASHPPHQQLIVNSVLGKYIEKKTQASSSEPNGEEKPLTSTSSTSNPNHHHENNFDEGKSKRARVQSNASSDSDIPEII